MPLLESSYSIVVPAKNEAERLEQFIPGLVAAHPEAEIFVVNDGSEDDTAEVAKRCGTLELSHPYSKSNGAAIKTGARAASNTNLLFMDGDGQHQMQDVAPLLEKLERGYELVVGARREGKSHINIWRDGIPFLLIIFKIDTLYSPPSSSCLSLC